MKRVVVQRLEGGVVRLSAEDVHHLVHVRRSRPGDEFEGILEDGGRLVCQLESGPAGDWFGRVKEVVADSHESSLLLHLAPSLIKREKFEAVIQKVVELGVHRIIPIFTARTEIHLDQKRREKKMARWRKIVREAAKQCGRDSIPDLVTPLSLAELLNEWTGELRVALDEKGGRTLKEAASLVQADSRCLLIVGPEGGWDEIEREIMDSHNVVRVRMGPRVLRAETASIVATGLLQYLAGDLGQK
jgi:16S rRNA (uracil1498-N3)-methyltransferase